MVGRGDGKGGEAGKNFLGSVSGHWEKVPQEVGQPGERGGREDGRRQEKPKSGHRGASPSTHVGELPDVGSGVEWGLPTSAGDSPGGGLGDRAERGRTGEGCFLILPEAPGTCPCLAFTSGCGFPWSE